MTKELKQTVAELLAGIWILALALLLVTLPVMGCFSGWETSHTKVLLGFTLGGALSSFMAVHMAISIDGAVDKDEDAALNHTRKMYAIRTAIVFVAVVLLYYTGWVNLISLFVGVFLLKPAVYMQPLLHRIFFGKDEEGQPYELEITEEDLQNIEKNPE